MAQSPNEESGSSAPPLYVWLICGLILGVLGLIGIALFLVLDDPLQLLVQATGALSPA